ncbi:PaaI family thioesterase [Pedobacter boryungensis]|uniref:PaaI family thioesterase n=1 Tax=Pedobacter boryungensis TaxID=869962 RepID=A0ABX2D9F0_9SPHI|nr:PaaI family thioesterase [Pedobacter boryungensis]NQX30659.1 PaaI family thioesterase [Pedobacter boryungensis]
MEEQNKLQQRLIIFQSFTGKEITNSPSHFMNWLKPTLISAEKGTLHCSYIVRKEMTNPYGILHGGITAGIIDDLIGATVYILGLNARFTTINNSIDYFAPANEGDEITAKTTVVKQGKTIINLQCEVFLPTKKRLIAKGYSNMLNIG